MLTVLGIALRIHEYGQTLVGDELSTLWIVDNHGLRDTISFVKGDGEITPPLYFILAWFATRLGDDPELVRLPAMLAGIASIPLMFLFGLRTAGRAAGLAATAIFAFSPFMIYFAANGRSYSVMTFLLICSTLTMLAGVRTGRTRWWIAYAAVTVLAMYTHYTALFVLGGQFVWLMWAHPGARKAGLISTLAAGVAFLPWAGGLSADLGSPTTTILAAIQGSGFETKLDGFAVWAFGHPLMPPGDLPGAFVIGVILMGVVVAMTGAGVRFFSATGSLGDRLRRVPREYVLVAVLALATPVCEIVLLVFGTDLLGARNLTASSSGLALALGAVTVSAGFAWSAVATVLVVGGFAAGAVKMVQPDAANPDYAAIAESIDREPSPDPVVVDTYGSQITPVPLSPLDLYLAKRQNFVPLNRPSSPPPYLPWSTVVPSPDRELRDAFREADGGKVYIIKQAEAEVGSTTDPGNEGLDPDQPAWRDGEVILPRDARIVETRAFEGISDLSVLVIDSGSASAAR